MAKAKSKSKKLGKDVEKKKLNLSKAERERRSKAMKKRIAEGKAGPAFGKLGGRPKKKRAAEIAAEVASEHGKEMAQVFLDAMASENPNSIRMKAAEGLYKIEDKEARLQMDEEEHVRKMSRGDLIDELANMFAQNPMLMQMFKTAAIEAKPPPDQPEVLEAEIVSD